MQASKRQQHYHYQVLVNYNKSNVTCVHRALSTTCTANQLTDSVRRVGFKIVG